jgi:hypothetical protein
MEEDFCGNAMMIEEARTEIIKIIGEVAHAQ